MSELIPQSEYEVITSRLTAEEQVIVKELLQTNQAAVDVLPDDMEPLQVWRYLSATCKGVSLTQKAAARLKLFLGRLLVLVQKNPELYNSQGFEKFNDFMTKGVPQLFGISRPEAYITKRINEELGERLSVDQMLDIGISKLNVASNAIRQKTPAGTSIEIRERTAAKWIDIAQNKTFDEMKQSLVDENIVAPGEVDSVTVIFNLKQATYERFCTFRNEPWVKRRAGESDSDVLEGMMQECSSWEAEEGAEAEAVNNDGSSQEDSQTL